MKLSDKRVSSDQVLKEGSLREVARLFLAPLVKYRPKNVPFYDFIERNIFGIDKVRIDRYVLRKGGDPFNVQFGKRKVLVDKDTHIFVRIDKTDMEYVDFQICNRGLDETHRITYKAWFTLRQKLDMGRRRKPKRAKRFWEVRPKK